MFLISTVLLASLILLYFVPLACGHGMMLDPPGRSSRWRFNESAPINNDDNAVQCGGITMQWHVNDGKCGLCGDEYGLPRPRPNEIGGEYGGEGIITHSYSSAQTLRVGVDLTANHLGYIYFNICNLDEFIMESEDCFIPNVLFTDGSERFYVETRSGLFYTELRLPEKLVCKHCVLRWTYIAGNNWGMCPNGTEATGCGPQEQFVSCADISITNLYAYNDLLTDMETEESRDHIAISIVNLNDSNDLIGKSNERDHMTNVTFLENNFL